MSDTPEVIAELDGGGGYEWSTVQLGKDANGSFWYRNAAGCSCDWIDMYPWKPAETPADLNHAIREWYGYEPNDAVKRAEFTYKVRQLMNGES